MRVEWERAPEWQKSSSIKGVEFCAEGNLEPGSIHNNWVKQKIDDGWVYGPIKDEKLKEHPCIVSFDELSTEQKSKDYIFIAVVKSLLNK